MFRLFACGVVLSGNLLLTILAFADDASFAIISRADWGARPWQQDISTYTEYGIQTPDYTSIVLHVTSMGQGSGNEEAQRIQSYHMNIRGFSDIGYNFLIDSSGNIYEGRLHIMSSRYL